MDYTAVAIFIFIIIMVVNFFWMARKVENIEKMLTAILDGGKFIVPKVRDGMQMLELAVKTGKKIAQRAKEKRASKRIKNMGQTLVVPDVDDAMLTRFYRKLKQMHDGGTDYKMTEDYWYPDIWQGIGGTSKEQMRKVFDRAEAAGVLKRGNPSAKNSTRVLASYAALRRLAG